MRAIGVLAFLALLAASAGAQTYFEYSTMVTDTPTSGAIWNEIWPEYGTSHVQNDYDDNGDGRVGIGDSVVLSDVSYTIDWAGPTYRLSGFASDSAWIAEPAYEAYSVQDPTGLTWYELYPQFMRELVVEGWEDNGDGRVGPRDRVYVRGQWWQLYGVRLSIIGMAASPVEESTWTGIKELFRSAAD